MMEYLAQKIKVVELFAGVGGFRLGLEAASSRFKTIWANQWEPFQKEQFAFNCYVSHFGKEDNYVCADIATVKSEVPNHDLLVGGFPCQDYSVLKKSAEGIEGQKGRLWWEVAAILTSRHPKFVVLENVDRLIVSPAKQKGRDFSMILRSFYENGYAVEWRVINAAEYGQGQRRRRTFIVACHKETKYYKCLAEQVCKQWLKTMHRYIIAEGILANSFPIDCFAKEYLDCWIDELEFSSMREVSERQQVCIHNSGMMINGRVYSIETKAQLTEPILLKSVLENKILDEHYFIKDEDLAKWEYVKGAKNEKRKRADGTEYFFAEGAVAFPDRLDKPSRTLITTESQLSRMSHVVSDPHTGRLRTLTPIECERLNGFPDDWTAGMPEKMRYFCMGNALVVPIVTRIGSVLADCI